MLTPAKPFDSMKRAAMPVFIALGVAMFVPEIALASGDTQNQTGTTLLALDDCDQDNNHRTFPFGDRVLLLNSRGELFREIPRLTVGKNWLGCRAVAASEDGRFFVVCEDSADEVTMYQASTGMKLWSLSGFFQSAVFADGLVYALARDSVYAIDRTGTIVKHARIGGGFDIAFDPSGKCLWIVGMNIKKCDLDLKLQFRLSLPFSTLTAGAFSVDVNPDGSAWVAGSNAHERYDAGNQLVKISPQGQSLRTIDLDFCPQCVRIDKSDGSVWTTGRIRRKDYSRIGDEWPETLAELEELVELPVQNHTRKYDAEGRLLVASTRGGMSIEVDPSDGSVWIAGDKSLWHHSSTGSSLSTYEGVSAKWLAIVP